MAQAGQRVLLIDADMRKGFLHRWLADDGHQGLSDMLVGNVTAEQAVRKTAIANLDFVPRGQVPPNPSELLMHRRFADFLRWAGQNYDLQNGVTIKGVILNGMVKKAATDMSYYNFAYPSHREERPQAGE